MRIPMGGLSLGLKGIAKKAQVSKKIIFAIELF
jgi:hypothetical protein